jgi:hypothetical protein
VRDFDTNTIRPAAAQISGDANEETLSVPAKSEKHSIRTARIAEKIRASYGLPPARTRYPQDIMQEIRSAAHAE